MLWKSKFSEIASLKKIVGGVLVINKLDCWEDIFQEMAFQKRNFLARFVGGLEMTSSVDPCLGFASNHMLWSPWRCYMPCSHHMLESVLGWLLVLLIGPSCPVTCLASQQSHAQEWFAVFNQTCMYVLPTAWKIFDHVIVTCSHPERPCNTSGEWHLAFLYQCLMVWVVVDSDSQCFTDWAVVLPSPSMRWLKSKCMWCFEVNSSWFQL